MINDTLARIKLARTKLQDDCLPDEESYLESFLKEKELVPVDIHVDDLAKILTQDLGVANIRVKGKIAFPIPLSEVHKKGYLAFSARINSTRDISCDKKHIIFAINSEYIHLSSFEDTEDFTDDVTELTSSRESLTTFLCAITKEGNVYVRYLLKKPGIDSDRFTFLQIYRMLGPIPVNYRNQSLSLNSPLDIYFQKIDSKQRYFHRIMESSGKFGLLSKEDIAFPSERSEFYEILAIHNFMPIDGDVWDFFDILKKSDDERSDKWHSEEYKKDARKYDDVLYELCVFLFYRASEYFVLVDEEKPESYTTSDNLILEGILNLSTDDNKIVTITEKKGAVYFRAPAPQDESAGEQDYNKLKDSFTDSYKDDLLVSYHKSFFDAGKHILNNP